MLRVNFTSYGSYVTDSLYQWDKNRTLSIEGLSLDVIPEIHFTNKIMENAIARQATKESESYTVKIPNSILQSPFNIIVYVGFYEGDLFKTVEKIEIPIIPRRRPADYTIEDTDEEIYSFVKLENEIANRVPMKTYNENNTNINKRIDSIAKNQIPEEYLKASVDEYVNNNSGGFATQANLEDVYSSLSSEIAEFKISDLEWNYGIVNDETGLIEEFDTNKYFILSEMFTVYKDSNFIYRKSNTGTIYTVKIYKYDLNGEYIGVDSYEVSTTDLIVSFDDTMRIRLVISLVNPPNTEITSDIKNTLTGKAIYEHKNVDIPHNLCSFEEINVLELKHGYIEKGANSRTDNEQFRCKLLDCKDGDVFIYSGTVSNLMYSAQFMRADGTAIGYVGDFDKTTYSDNVIVKVPKFCDYMVVNFFIRNGGTNSKLLKMNYNHDNYNLALTKEILEGYNCLKGLKININGDSLSTEDAGLWSRLFKYNVVATLKNIAVGGTRMQGEINSDERIALLDSDADLVLTNGGANDWAQDIPLGSIDDLDDTSTFAGAVALYIQKVMVQCPNARIVCLGSNYVYSQKREDTEKNNIGLRIKDYNDMYRKVCEFLSIEFVNIYELCGINRFNYQTFLVQDTHDWGYSWIHPNDLGATNILNVILNYFRLNKNH